jgi:protein-tyrosine phosphatase
MEPSHRCNLFQRIHMAQRTMKTPIPDSYWLVEGRLLAGEYPATTDPHATREKLARFLDAGIRTFIDLTEESELERYDGILEELSAERGIETRYVRSGIRDISVPRDHATMEAILDTIAAEIAADRPVYVHCWGGVGRTGTVIGCWLIEQGLTGPAAIERIAELRRITPKGRRASPETDAQCRYICEWSSGRETPPATPEPGPVT